MIRTDGQTLEAGAAAALFQTRIVGGGTGLAGANTEQYAVAPDGQRFLINVTTEEDSVSPITVVTNWTASLKKK